MTIISHVLITALGVKAMNLTGNDLFYAYAFGVLPDLDHIVKIPRYLKENKLKIVRHFHWRTFFQEPIMLLPVFVFGLLVQSWVPFVFFSIHVLMDYLMSFEKLPFAPLYNFKTNGLLCNIRDIYKEFTLIASVIVSFVFI